jgi:hypothetical protein
MQTKCKVETKYLYIYYLYMCQAKKLSNTSPAVLQIRQYCGSAYLKHIT